MEDGYIWLGGELKYQKPFARIEDYRTLLNWMTGWITTTSSQRSTPTPLPTPGDVQVQIEGIYKLIIHLSGFVEFLQGGKSNFCLLQIWHFNCGVSAHLFTSQPPETPVSNVGQW